MTSLLKKIDGLREKIPKAPDVDPLEGARKKMCKKNAAFYFKTVSPELVKRIILRLKNSKATGIDGIPTTILKKGVDVLVFPITWIINQSILSGQFPKKWKTSIVVPIHKKGNAKQMKNYRPVSNLCTTSKVLKIVVMKQLENFFEGNELFPVNQHGFRKGRSTTTAIASLHSAWTRLRAEGNCIGVTAFDLSAAFDIVPHDVLQEKLRAYGVGGTANRWIGSFLSDRTQMVRWGKAISDQNEVPWGTPQGSCLSPLLFLIYTADVEEYLQGAAVYSYADDTTTYIAGKDEQYVRTELEKDAANLLKYMAANLLVANPDKTQFMLINGRDRQAINIGNSKIERQDTLELLGLKVGQDLGFAAHVSDVLRSLDQRTGLLRRLSFYIPREKLQQIAEGICISKIRYGLAAYGVPNMEHGRGSKMMMDLQVKQNEIARVLTGVKRTDKVAISSLLNMAGMNSINRMTVETILLHTWRVLNSNLGDKEILLSRSNVSSMVTRAKTDGKLETRMPSSSFMYYGAKLWNMAPPAVKNAQSIYSVKKATKNFIDSLPL